MKKRGVILKKKYIKANKSGFVNKYIESKGKEPFEVLMETRKRIYKIYKEKEEEKKRKIQEEKDIKRIGEEIAKEVEKEMNKFF